MTKYFGFKDFRWANDDSVMQLEQYMKQTSGIDIKTNSRVGFLAEVDLLIPSSLHELFRVFPFIPDHKTVSSDDLSFYQKALKETLKIGSENAKLVCDFTKKKSYILTSYALKAYLRLGVKLSG